MSKKILTNSKIDITPLLIISFFILVLLIDVFASGMRMNYKSYAACLMSLISLVTYFSNNKLYRIAMILTLVLATINLLEFSFEIRTWGFGIRPKNTHDFIGVRIQPWSLGLLCFTFLIFKISKQIKIKEKQKIINQKIEKSMISK